MRRPQLSPARRRFVLVGAAFLAIDTVVLVLLFVAATHSALGRAADSADETVSFLESSCQKYENYSQGRRAETLQALEDSIAVFARFLPPDQVHVDDDLAAEFIDAEHLDGVVILDAGSNLVAEADSGARDAYVYWQDVLGQGAVTSVLRDTRLSYSNIIKRKGVEYAVVAVPYADGLAFAYRALGDLSSDAYGYDISNLLTDDTFHGDPTVILASASKVVSTNRKDLDAVLRRIVLSPSTVWEDTGLTRIDCDGETWYGKRSVYRDYTFYLLYPKGELFSGRVGFIIAGVTAYLAVCVAILVVRSMGDRKRLVETQKQMSIVQAISATYDTTFLLHLDTMQMEGISMSPAVAAVFARHPEPHEFLRKVCLDIVSPSSRDAVSELMDPETLEERLAGKAFLGIDIQTGKGGWYSLQVIPQHYAADGSLESVLVATRDVADVKRAEELSYRDKLTGLRNRNYLESRGDELLDGASLPVTVIMADCNYLKRTNDTMGHEWGDRLLQRVAAVLRTEVGENDLPMRIGGDEFLLVCPHRDEAAARRLMARIKTGLAGVSDDRLTVSVSLGSYTVTAPGTSMAEAYKAADASMYEEKQRAHEAASTKA